MENAFIESFNGRLRNECLNVSSFLSIAHAQELIERWRRDYNDRRPHGALGHLTPSEYAEQRQKPASEAAALQLAPPRLTMGQRQKRPISNSHSSGNGGKVTEDDLALSADRM